MGKIFQGRVFKFDRGIVEVENHVEEKQKPNLVHMHLQNTVPCRRTDNLRIGMTIQSYQPMWNEPPKISKTCFQWYGASANGQSEVAAQY